MSKFDYSLLVPTLPTLSLYGVLSLSFPHTGVMRGRSPVLVVAINYFKLSCGVGCVGGDLLSH